MKINRIFLCLILALSVVMQSISVFAIIDIPTQDIIDGAFRFDVGDFLKDDESAEGDLDSENINLLNELGLWDDPTISKDSLITMTELAVIMSKVKLGSENPFKEVYLNNTDETKADYRTVYEYLLHATGYYYRCKQYGGGDKALLIVASEIGLISGQSENINSYITRGNLAKLIIKAVNMDICVMEYNDEGYTYTVTKGKNILNTMHNIYNVSGFVNAVYGMSVYGGTGAREGYIQINRTDLKTSGEDFSQYFGRRVNAYAFFDSTVNQYNIIHISPEEGCNLLEIDFKDIIDIKNDTVYYIDEDGNEFEVFTGGIINIVENGQKINSIAQMSDFGTNEGKIVFTSTQKNSNFDTALIYKYDYFIVDYNSILENKIGFKYGMEYNGKSELNVNPYGVNVVTVDGKKSSVSGIKIGSAVRVYESLNTNYAEFVASTKKVTGTIEAIYDDKIEVGGTVYRLSKNLIERIKYCEQQITMSYYDKVLMPKFGDNVTLYFIDNVVAGFTVGREFSYGYLKVVGESRSGIDPVMSLRIFTQDNNWENFELADKLEFDGVRNVSRIDVAETIKKRIGTSADAIGEIIRYRINSDKKIVALDTIWEDANEVDTEDDIKRVSDPALPNGEWSGKMNWTRWFLDGTRYFMSPSAVLFVIPEDLDDEEDFMATVPTALPYKTPDNQFAEYTLALYNPDNFYRCAVVMYRGSLDVSTAEGDLQYMYVESIRHALIDAEEQIYGYKFTGMEFKSLAKGKGSCTPVSFYVTQDVYQKVLEEAMEKKGIDKSFSAGALIRILITDGMVENWEVMLPEGKIYEPEGKTFFNHEGRAATYDKYIGRITKIDPIEGDILVNCGPDGEYLVCPAPKGIINLSTKKLINAEISDFTEGDTVYVLASAARGNLMIKTIE